MAIISVSRELAALGDETAGELAKLPGWRFVDKRALEDRIKSCGVEDRKFRKYDERKPSFFASLSRDRDDYLHYLKTAIYTEAEQGNCVFIGRGAGMVFKNMPGHISLFLASPPGIRIERVKSYFQCDERRARQIIEHSDQDRVGFHRYFFDIDWKNPENYHLSLNTGFLYPADCAEIINHFKERFFTPEVEAQNAARLKALVLEQRIKHCIMYEREMPVHFFEVSISGGVITLYGVANSQSLIDSAVNAVREMTGNETPNIQNEIQVVQEYSVIP
ncbi:MAG: cytidylate kinase-like family protein [Treponema sp.]|jgi:cytidylate kinase|nr:cytidylate kinase-like family protein [Treponema sp.]